MPPHATGERPDAALEQFEAAAQRLVRPRRPGTQAGGTGRIVRQNPRVPEASQRDPTTTCAEWAVVTGAAGGIGSATVARLVADGWSVLAIDAPVGLQIPGAAGRLSPAAHLAALSNQWPDVVTTAVVDVRDATALESVVATHAERHGTPVAAVAVAGVVGGGQPLWLESPQTLTAMLEVNLLGAWHLSQAVIPAMLTAPERNGRFVVVVSTAAEHGLFHLGAYGISKAAAAGLVRGLAADLVGTGVTASGVSPGSTDTPMLAATADLYGVPAADLVARQGIRRVLQPEEIADLIAYACSPAGAALHGTVVEAGGGFGL